MTENPKPIISRVGTCRSGRAFDIPHEWTVEEAISFFDSLAIDDRVDVFCMVEARMSEIAASGNESHEDDSLDGLNELIWETGVVAELRPYLDALGLYTSPGYVRFGKSLLL